MRPFQFIDVQAAPAWLLKIGEYLSEIETEGKEVYRKSIPIMAPFVDLAISEGVMRKLAQDETGWELLEGEVAGKTDGIVRDARMVVTEFLKSVIGYQAEELDTYKHGDSETTRKMQNLQSEVFVLKKKEENYIERIRQLMRYVTEPAPPDPNKYSGKYVRNTALALALAGFAIGILSSPFLPFFK
jgi:hypothetical protein